ncbi:hypothetical protein ACJJIF_02140 [Microbulbifer sp. SSSA002]|uniref:hypothetical protein n=1 Tax=Microbulbifer sp. SSSA002 TaxID=3243376 RepID=UPI00403A455C
MANQQQMAAWKEDLFLALITYSLIIFIISVVNRRWGVVIYITIIRALEKG